VIIGGWRGPGWRVTDADPRLGSQIRDWIRSAVSGHGCPVDPADAALVVSELFGNACLYGPAGGCVLAGYCLWREGARLVVCDGGGTGAPRLVVPDELAEGGRGLHVIDTLAARWGSFRLPGARVVWSDLGQPLRVPGSDAWAWLGLALSVDPLSETAQPVAPRPRTATVPCGRGAGPAGPAGVR
jgi:anti-sigma regulatory factor (Ser/Thr protein kinase)